MQPDLKELKRLFADAMKAQPGRVDIGGNDDEYIAAHFPREFAGFTMARALLASQQQTPLDYEAAKTEAYRNGVHDERHRKNEDRSMSSQSAKTPEWTIRWWGSNSKCCTCMIIDEDGKTVQTFENADSNSIGAIVIAHNEALHTMTDATVSESECARLAGVGKQEPVAHLKFWAAQQWNGNGNNSPEVAEGLAVCEASEVGDDGHPAFPVFAATPSSEADAKDVERYRSAVDHGVLLLDGGAIACTGRKEWDHAIDAALASQKGKV